MKTFALAGNPNCGKTTLFNALTGSTAHVGNWPGVTVDKKEGIYKKLNENVAIIDLPGIYSLSPYTSEELITRNYILNEKPDCIINVIDATNLERNLYLTTQLLEMDVPIIVALNMMDILEKNKESIDTNKLSKKLGVPVFRISAQKEDGISLMMEGAYDASLLKREGKSILEGSEIYSLINTLKTKYQENEISNSLFHSIKLAEYDEIEIDEHKEFLKLIDEFKGKLNNEAFGNDIEAIIADLRYQYISNELNYKKEGIKTKDSYSQSDKIDKILTNKWVGIPIFLVILFLIFHLTFSENLFYLGGLFNNVSPSFEGSIFEGLIWTDAGINSPGVILQSLVCNITDWITQVVAGWMESTPSWLAGFICDGVLAGVFSVLSFVPQILLLFLFFSILEDSGYMARVAFILDRIFRKFGLSGRAFMPMIMGFGCSVPAMINTRTLADDNEKIATIRVIPFFSCGAKLPILTAIAGGICQIYGFGNVDIITYSMYLVGIVTAIITIIIMRNTIMRGLASPFIMELPQYHLPKFKGLMFHLWDKLKHYVKKAFTIILASTIVIWFLQSFTWNWRFIEQADVVGVADDVFIELINDEEFKNSLIELNEEFDDEELTLNVVMLNYIELENDDEIAAYDLVLSPVFSKASLDYLEITSDKDYLDTSDSILAGLGQLITPIFTPLGFGSQLNQNGWVFGVAAGTGLIAKENVISTFAVLAECISNNENINKEEYKNLYIVNLDEEGVSASVRMIENTNATWPALISFIVFNMTTIPCFAAVATAKGELSKKRFKGTLLFWLLTSYIASMICYLILSYWWTSFIFISIFTILGFGINYYNKYKDNKKRVDI